MKAMENDSQATYSTYRAFDKEPSFFSSLDSSLFIIVLPCSSAKDHILKDNWAGSGSTENQSLTTLLVKKKINALFCKVKPHFPVLFALPETTQLTIHANQQRMKATHTPSWRVITSVNLMSLLTYLGTCLNLMKVAVHTGERAGLLEASGRSTESKGPLQVQTPACCVHIVTVLGESA